jgi:protein-S-isoprenylcysteine O-methyltransferase Ste14
VAGWILTTLGAAIVVAFLISKLTNWFPLASIFGLVGLLLILIGLYLIYIVPHESVE